MDAIVENGPFSNLRGVSFSLHEFEFAQDSSDANFEHARSLPPPSDVFVKLSNEKVVVPYGDNSISNVHH